MNASNGRPQQGREAPISREQITATGLPVRPLHNPLTSEDEVILQNVIERTAVHADLAARMKEAGLDVSDHENRNAVHHHVASTLKKLFFPTQLTPPSDES